MSVNRGDDDGNFSAEFDSIADKKKIVSRLCCYCIRGKVSRQTKVHSSLWVLDSAPIRFCFQPLLLHEFYERNSVNPMKEYHVCSAGTRRRKKSLKILFLSHESDSK